MYMTCMCTTLTHALFITCSVLYKMFKARRGRQLARKICMFTGIPDGKLSLQVKITVFQQEIPKLIQVRLFMCLM
jgi:hypothetical protein